MWDLAFCVSGMVHEWDFRGCKDKVSVKDKHSPLNATGMNGTLCTDEGMVFDAKNTHLLGFLAPAGSELRRLGNAWRGLHRTRGVGASSAQAERGRTRRR